MMRPLTRERKRSRSGKQSDDSPESPSKVSKKQPSSQQQAAATSRSIVNGAASVPKNGLDIPLSDEVTQDIDATPTKASLVLNHHWGFQSISSVVSPEAATVPLPPSPVTDRNKVKQAAQVESEPILGVQTRSRSRANKDQTKEESREDENGNRQLKSPYDARQKTAWVVLRHTVVHLASKFVALLHLVWVTLSNLFQTHHARERENLGPGLGAWAISSVKDYANGVKGLALEVKIQVLARMKAARDFVLVFASGIKKQMAVVLIWANYFFQSGKGLTRKVKARTILALTVVLEFFQGPKGILTALNSRASAAIAAVNEFFHSRTGPDGCVLGGWLRIGYASLYLIDRMLWTVDLDFFFYQNGLVPTNVGRNLPDIYQDEMYTIFQLAPESDWLVWAVNYLGLVQGVLLLLGVAPRFQIACILVNLASWHNQNCITFDSQDILLRTFAFLLCFLPLHRLSIYEWWHTRGMTKEEKSVLYEIDSWPMWPFRLWQIQICFIYAGAGLAKLSSKVWIQGIALYRAIHTEVFGTLFYPDILFNRLLPLKLMCWSSLLLENLCWILIWPVTTRILTLIAVVLLHVGIDLSMNMNIFEWLVILGWMSFLVRPDEKQSTRVPQTQAAPDKDTKSNGKSGHHQERSRRKRWLNRMANVFIVSYLVVFGAQTSPMQYFQKLAPAPLKPTFAFCRNISSGIMLRTRPWLRRAGIVQQRWSMFSDPKNYNERIEAIISFHNDTNVSWWSPDFGSMSGWQKKRNRRHTLYWEHLMVYDNEMAAAHRRLCHLLAQQHGQDVAKIKLVIHSVTAPDPPAEIGWFEPAKRPKEEMITERRTLFIYYPPEVCMQWAIEGYCHTDAKFMLKRCAKNCKDEYATSKDVEVGSRIEVYWEDEFEFFSAKVKKIRDGEATRFLLEWDGDGSEWFNLDDHLFRFVGDDEEEEEDEDDEDSDDDEEEEEYDNDDDAVLDETPPSEPEPSPVVTYELDYSVSSPIGLVYVAQQLQQQADGGEKTKVASKEQLPLPEPIKSSGDKEQPPALLSDAEPTLGSLGDNWVDFKSFPIGFEYVKQKLLEINDD